MSTDFLKPSMPLAWTFSFSPLINQCGRRFIILALYADPRGFNLRNDLAHDLGGADRMTMAVASRALHTLLVLGIWDALAKATRATKEGSTTEK